MTDFLKQLQYVGDDELREEAHRRGMELVSKEFHGVAANLIREIDKMRTRLKQLEVEAQKLK